MPLNCVETSCRLPSNTDIPYVVISPKTRGMFPSMRLFVLFMFATLAILYSVLQLSTMYFKDQRLDRISNELDDSSYLSQGLIALKRMDERLADGIDELQQYVELK